MQGGAPLLGVLESPLMVEGKIPIWGLDSLSAVAFRNELSRQFEGRWGWMGGSGGKLMVDQEITSVSRKRVIDNDENGKNWATSNEMRC